MSKKIIGLVGPIASGKGAAVKFLEEAGYVKYSLSDRIREELKSRGLDETRENLQNMANKLREEFGSDILARRTADIIDNQKKDKVVIDSIRNPKEIEFLRSHYQIKVVGVTASQEKRFELMKIRGNPGDPDTYEEFQRLDNLELEQEGEYKQQVNKTLALSDVIIENNGTIDELREKITTLL